MYFSMKKTNFLTMGLLCFTLFLSAQTEQQKADIEIYKPLYKVDDGSVIFTKVFEGIEGNKDEIYTKVLNYFAVAYKSANDVIQQKDKDAGVIIGKGIFEVYRSGGLVSSTYDCYHTIRIDIKDGRVRVALSVNNYELKMVTSKGTDRYTYAIVDNYPISEGTKLNRKNYADVFIGLCATTVNTFAAIEKSLKESSTFAPSDDW